MRGMGTLKRYEEWHYIFVTVGWDTNKESEE